MRFAREPAAPDRVEKRGSLTSPALREVDSGLELRLPVTDRPGNRCVSASVVEDSRKETQRWRNGDGWQVKASHDQGLSLEEAIAKLDMSDYDEFAAFQSGRSEVRELEVRRMYHLLDGGE